MQVYILYSKLCNRVMIVITVHTSSGHPKRIENTYYNYVKMKYENKTAVLMKEKEGRKGETTICSHFFETVPPKYTQNRCLTVVYDDLGYIYIHLCVHNDNVLLW